jgi:biofilm PGA synthesis N-glycosyltransferase PgaC
MHWLPAILILPYLFIFMKIYRNLLVIKQYHSKPDPGIFISIVIACKNEEENIDALLNDLTEQDYPAQLFEVIIVDDHSEDQTFRYASGFSGIENLKVISNDGYGKKRAIRTGILLSKGELIITTDGDCRMGAKWIRTIMSFYKDFKPDMIICPVKLESRPGILNRFQELEFLSLQGVTAGSAISGNGTMCNGANLAFTRNAYMDHSSSLHEELASGDDVFLLHSLKKDQKSDIRWLEASDALVTSTSVPSLLSFIRQRKRWISKIKAYSDTFTIILAIVTFVTILLELTLFVISFINPTFWPVFFTVFLIKAIPDFLILRNSARRYAAGGLMKWFPFAQVIYPFYVISVVCWPVFPAGRKYFNSPFPREI